MARYVLTVDASLDHTGHRVLRGEEIEVPDDIRAQVLIGHGVIAAPEETTPLQPDGAEGDSPEDPGAPETDHATTSLRGPAGGPRSRKGR